MISTIIQATTQKVERATQIRYNPLNSDFVIGLRTETKEMEAVLTQNL